MITFQAITLFEGWKLYSTEYTWSNWIKYLFNIVPESETYIMNPKNGEVSNSNEPFIKIGQFGQETESPYIYMTDSSYIQLLPCYNNVIKQCEFAKQCQIRYNDSISNDI
jgi:hypothetical protein